MPAHNSGYAAQQAVRADRLSRPLNAYAFGDFVERVQPDETLPPWVPGMRFVPVRWWTRHPWFVGWLAAIMVIFAFIGWITSAYGILCRPGLTHSVGYVSAIAFCLLVLLWTASAVQGWRVSRPRSRGRAILGVVTVFFVPVVVMFLVGGLCCGVHPRARIAKAQADVRTLVSAVAMYREHMGNLPTRLNELTETTVNAKGNRAGPFLSMLPNPPACWTTYRYEIRPGDAFRISASGDETTVQHPD